MKNGITPYFFVIFFCHFVHAQDSFEPGYIVNEIGKRITCLIREPYWKINPTTIEYKLLFNDSVKFGTVDNLREFFVGKHTKYISALVEINESSDDQLGLDHEISQRFSERRVFLRVLIEGNASLYELNTPDSARFFYQKAGGTFKQLIYETYKDSANKIISNYTFRTQLNKELDCGSLAAGIKIVHYYKPQLVNYFKEYNICSVSDYISYSKLVRPFRFSFRPGPKWDSYSIYIQDENEIKRGIRPSVEMEALLPFKKPNWALFTELSFQSFSSDPVMFAGSQFALKYNGIEVPAGLRFYLPLTEKNKFFFNGMLVMDIPFSNTFTKLYAYEIKNPKIATVFGLGAGLKIDRLDTQFRWYSKRYSDIDLTGYDYGFHKWSYSIGYRWY